jgi:hypothetical protein
VVSSLPKKTPKRRSLLYGQKALAQELNANGGCMNVTDYRETYYTLSGKASDISRQLSLAGIALIWIFKREKGGPLDVPGALLIPASLFIVALALDLLQYAIGTGIWGLYARYHENRDTAEDEELSAPIYFNWPALICFWLKIFFVVFAYFEVFQYIQSLLPHA